MATGQSLQQTVMRGLLGSVIYAMIIGCSAVLMLIYVVVELTQGDKTAPIATEPVIQVLTTSLKCVAPFVYIVIMGVVEYVMTKDIKKVLIGALVVAPVLLMMIYAILFVAYAVILGLFLGIAESGGF